jgi:hypothetical protein
MPQIVEVDGVGQMEFPDGMSQSDMASAIQRHMFRQTGTAPNSPSSLPRMPPVDPLAGMSRADIMGAASGKAFRDVYRGVKQTFNIGDQTALQAEIDRAKKDEAALMKSPWGFGANLATNALMLAPTALIPGVNTVAGAGLLGAALGGLQPTASDESTGVNMALGAAGGSVGQGIANTIGTAVRGLRSSYAPEARRLVDELSTRVPLDAAQRTGSRTLSLLDAAFENLPGTSTLMQGRRAEQQSAFNRAVAGTFGSADNELTKPAMRGARDRIGSEIGAVAQRNTMNVTNDVLNRLGDIESYATRTYGSDIAPAITSQVDDILNKMSNGTMAGDVYRAKDSELGRLIRQTTNGDRRAALGDLRNALREAMDASISPADAQAWANARRQYANLMRVSESGIDASGNVSPAKLANTSMRQNNRFQSNDLDELARAGGVALRKTVGDSGTAQRAMYQGALTGGGGLAGYMAGGGDPRDAATGAIAGLAFPLTAYAALSNPATRAILSRGLLGPSPMSNGAVNALTPFLRGGGVGLGLLSNPNQ